MIIERDDWWRAVSRVRAASSVPSALSCSPCIRLWEAERETTVRRYPCRPDEVVRASADGYPLCPRLFSASSLSMSRCSSALQGSPEFPQFSPRRRAGRNTDTLERNSYGRERLVRDAWRACLLAASFDLRSSLSALSRSTSCTRREYSMICNQKTTFWFLIDNSCVRRVGRVAGPSLSCLCLCGGAGAASRGLRLHLRPPLRRKKSILRSVRRCAETCSVTHSRSRS